MVKKSTPNPDLTTLQRTELEELLNITEANAQPVKLKDNAGRLSRMDEMHNQSILLANRNVTKNRLRQVLVAQARIDKEQYGYCTTCDESVAFNRLKAYPEAAMCLQCQSEVEANQD
jgi:DnaK suppressor protein